MRHTLCHLIAAVDMSHGAVAAIAGGNNISQMVSGCGNRSTRPNMVIDGLRILQGCRLVVTQLERGLRGRREIGKDHLEKYKLKMLK